MKAGIQIEKAKIKEVLFNTKFDQIELRFQDCSLDLKESLRGHLAGISIPLHEFDTKNLTACIDYLTSYGGSYVVIETMNEREDYTSKIAKCLKGAKEQLDNSGISILIENGCLRTRDDCYVSTMYSHADVLLSMCDCLGKQIPELQVGLCCNVGIANLTGINTRTFLERLGSSVFLVHINDNDGKSDQRQIPFTFTTGRGKKSTDWNRIIGQLIRQNYEGVIVFDTRGLFECCPSKLVSSFVDLLYGIYEEWNKQADYEEILKEANQTGILLFGAGQMAAHYMEKWGDMYPPSYLTDNNPMLWGTKRYGIPVISPEEIKNTNCRVIICNQYYSAIKKQLQELGISYDCYNDEYDF